MKYSILALALLVAGCNGIADNPVGPTLVQPVFETTPPQAPPPGPHFALEIQGATQIDDSQPWAGIVSVLANPSIIRPEFPVRVVTTCGSTIQAHPLGSGSVRISCPLVLGANVIGAVAEMVDGRRYPTALGVTVRRATEPPLNVFFSLFESDGNGNTVTFSVRDVARATRYNWDFGDGERADTMRPIVNHLFKRPSGERRVTATAVDSDGATITTGAVVARW